MPPHWHRLIWQGLHSFIEVPKVGASVYCGHISSLFFFGFFCFFFLCTFYRLLNGSLVICHWVFCCPGHQCLQCFDCNNKLVRSISLKIFYSFTNITLPLLRIFGEHSSVSPMLLLSKLLLNKSYMLSGHGLSSIGQRQVCHVAVHIPFHCAFCLHQRTYVIFTQIFCNT